MKRALLHGFLGDPSVWDGIASNNDVLLALPGHVGGDQVRPTWAENLDAIAERARGCDLVIGYSQGARVALGLLAMGAVPRAVLISVNPGIEETRAGIDEKSRAGIDEKSRAGIDEKSRAGIDEKSRSGDERSRADDDRSRDVDATNDERNARRASDAAWARRFRTEPLSDVLDAWETQPLFATQARVAPDALAARRARRLALDPAQIAQNLEAMGLAEMPDYHAVVDDRCTLIVGADDSKYLAIARVLHARCHVIDECGHDPLLEQPAALAKVLASIV